MISISNLYEGIDQIMSFCRGREELSSGKSIIRNTYIYDKVIVILLIVSENFYATFFAKKNILTMFELSESIEIWISASL